MISIFVLLKLNSNECKNAIRGVNYIIEFVQGKSVLSGVRAIVLLEDI